MLTLKLIQNQGRKFHMDQSFLRVSKSADFVVDPVQSRNSQRADFKAVYCFQAWSKCFDLMQNHIYNLTIYSYNLTIYSYILTIYSYNLTIYSYNLT